MLSLPENTFRPETLAKYEKMKELIRAGTNHAAACKQAKINASLYQRVREIDPDGIFLRGPNRKKTKAKRKYAQRLAKPANFIDLPLAATPAEKVIIIVAATTELKNILEQLR